MKEEIWKDIKGFEGLYKISSFGRVMSFKRYKDGRILKPGEYSNGYLFVHLCNNDGVKKSYSIHRLVAGAFIPNPGNLPQVNHKNTNKTCNENWNLEWCSASENIKHAIHSGVVKNQCKIIRPVIIENETSTISFDSIKDCCLFFGFTKCWLGNYSRKKGNPCYYNGYKITILKRGDNNDVR